MPGKGIPKEKLAAIKEDMAANLFDFWAHRERLVGEARDRAWKAERSTFLTVVDNQFYYLTQMRINLETNDASLQRYYDTRAKFVSFYSNR